MMSFAGMVVSQPDGRALWCILDFGHAFATEFLARVAARTVRLPSRQIAVVELTMISFAAMPGDGLHGVKGERGIAGQAEGEVDPFHIAWSGVVVKGKRSAVQRQLRAASHRRQRVPPPVLRAARSHRTPDRR